MFMAFVNVFHDLYRKDIEQKYLELQPGCSMMSTANLLHQLHICLLITVKNSNDIESLILQGIFIASVSQS